MNVITPYIQPLITAETTVRAMTASPDLPHDRLVGKMLLVVPAGTSIPGSPSLKFRGDIFASIDWTRDGVLINSCLFEEDGYGRTYEEAWDDFISSLRDKRASLEKRAGMLSAADRRIFEDLRSSIIDS